MHKIQIKFRNWALVFATLCVVSAGFLLTSCEGEEEADPKVVLYSFGPMPIARGAELKFIGANLDKVTAVVLPDNITITTFTKKESGLLTLTVPQEAMPGYVTLKTPDGNITTKTTIGYSEPISIASFTPATVKAGDVLTITGDYLNLVGEVILTDRIVVSEDDFTSHTRTEIKLVVPAEAQTGKIAVSNAAEEPIIVYSANTLTVTLPAFTSVTPNPVKAGTNLTITGTNLDLVLSVKLGGGKVIDAEDFDSHNATQIVISVPEDTKDGKVIMVPASGVEVTTAEDLVMVIPTVTVTPVTLKNGEDITVTGTNLDLIDHVIFGGDKQGTIKAGGTATQILVTVPDDAVDGVVTFVTKADKEITGPNLTMIVPAFSSFSPTSARAKTSITLSGTDLDLVTKVIFTGGLEGAIGTQTRTSLAVTVPVGAKTGKITIVTKNGTQVISAIDFTLLANLPTFGSYGETRGEPGKILTINGTNMLLVKELIFPGNKTATAYGSKTDTKIEVYVPEDVTFGTGTIGLVTYEGEEGFFPAIYFGGTDPVIDQTYCFFDFNGTGKDSWWGNAIGSGILADAANSADGTPFWNINGMGGTGWWDGLFFRNGSNNYVTTGVDVNTWAVRFDINVRETISEGEFRIRLGSYYYHFQPWNGVAGGFKTTGWITVTCPLTGFVSDGGEVIPDAALGGSEFGFIWSHGVSVKVNVGIDNVRFEPIN
jgi:hypothetical protein